MIRRTTAGNAVERGSSSGIKDLSQKKLETLLELFGIPNPRNTKGVLLTQQQRFTLYTGLCQTYFPFTQFDRPGAFVKDVAIPKDDFEDGLITIAKTEKGLQSIIAQSEVLPIQFDLSGRRESAFPLLLTSTISALCIPKELLIEASRGQNIGIVVTQRGADFNSSLFYRLTLNDQSKDAAVLKLELVNNNAYERAAQDIVEEKMEIMEKSHSVFFISPSE